MTQRLISHREILETTREQLNTLPELCRGQGLSQVGENGGDLQHPEASEKPLLAGPTKEHNR